MSRRKAQETAVHPAPGGHTPVTLDGHPRARHAIETWRAWAGLGAFALSMLLGWQAAVPFVELVGRSIVLGAGAFVGVWAASLVIWRQLVLAEVAAARRRAREQREELLAEAEQLAADAQRQ